MLGLALLCAPAGCANRVPIVVGAGPFEVEVDTARVVVPMAYRGRAETVARLACTTQAQCPSLGAGLPAVRCVSAVCDPEPVPLDLAAGGVIDLDAYSEQLEALADRIAQVDVQQLTFAASPSGLRVPVGPTEVYWGPETATGPGSEGVWLLGRLPVLGTAGATAGAATLDARGREALGAHLLGPSKRFRLFVRAPVDLVPGGPLPSGRVRVALQVQLVFEGELAP